VAIGDPVSDYGEIVLQSHYGLDGTVTAITVLRADEVIGVSKALLDEGILTLSDAGYIVVDTAGEYVYRPVRFADQGRVVVCERVR
jgi:hypothetical protein